MKSQIKITITAVVLFAFSFGQAQSTSEFFTKADTFFKTHVKNGRVAYKAIKSDPASLNELISMAENITVSKANANEYQAFWINGYNLSVIKGIVDNYPIKSPLDKAGFFDKIKHNIGGKKTTLNDIENKLLRAVYPNEARFHFVLVCAGLGCPPIINNAYLPSTLDSQLEKQTKIALNNPSFIKVNKNKVKISQIFEWYTGDFKKNGKSLVDYINQYRTTPLPAKSKVSYYPYDWALNEIK
ncbi:DUF547 domain-containing protein [Spongiimicrobium salis]|uniref:DUF547 domain-containing protein n=1 Tax=Spongiimicrobium salis TaxID=1667022 RepID=UPI00374D3F42